MRAYLAALTTASLTLTAAGSSPND